MSLESTLKKLDAIHQKHKDRVTAAYEWWVSCGGTGEIGGSKITIDGIECIVVGHDFTASSANIRVVPINMDHNIGSGCGCEKQFNF